MMEARETRLEKLCSTTEAALHSVLRSLEGDAITEWKNHPCTQALQLYLDFITIDGAVQWSNHGCDTSADQRLQQDANELGRVQSAMGIADFIYDFKLPTLEGTIE